MKTSYYQDILRGRSQELPDVRSKVVRVFVSSTFTDTLAERDSLIENIFPKLKDYCREKYGLEFQYADMRWGIQNESANNHGEVATCLKEIELCKKYSVATNFVVLLSHRYGSRPIPAQIPAILFELLKSTVLAEFNEGKDGDLLTQWYQLDTNSLPPTYVLQDISSILPNFLSKDTDRIKQADKEWKKINNRLRLCLRRAAETCLHRKQITEKDYDQFFVSVTEKEIIDGILAANDANARTLCFFREIVDIRDHLTDEKASKYIDLSSEEKDHALVVDQEADKLLDRLKNSRVPSALQASNIFKYQVRWSSAGIDRQNHAEYIEKFNHDFYTAMKAQIDHCAQSRATIAPTSLQQEVLEHAIQCKTYVSKFHGRSDVLSHLETYVKKAGERRPYVVHGESGCGKTSVLAKTATEVFQWWPNKSVSVILRFLGTTPGSSTIYKTLLSISEQVCEIYRLSMTTYPTVGQLQDQLESRLLSQIPDDEYLLILLDSIDQLQSDAYDCKWVTREFPPNVKCILSTLPDHGNILTNLELLFPTSKTFIHVPPFQPAAVEAVYNDWLTRKHRALSDEQRVFVNGLMSKRKEILPLFMKLVFDIVSVWHSYDTIDERLNELNDVDDCIRYLFRRLEIIHHRTLFSRALCYMTAFRSGISQNELEDILSLDDEVLKSVFQHYIPPVRRVPGILWTRIRNDLDEYITEKEVDDAPVIYWYHRRFIEVARELYVSNLDEEVRKIVFQNVVDFYKETWKGKNKPFKIDDPKLASKYKLDQNDGEIQANRLTTSQPIEFMDAEGRIQYNKRKLSELPLFLSKLAADISIPIAAEEILFNYSFMHAKFACIPFTDVIHEISTFQKVTPYKTSKTVEGILGEIKSLNMVYLLFGHVLNEYPDNYAFELTARLLSVYNHKPNFTSLMKQCDEQAVRHCALVVPYSQMQPPGNGLLFVMNKHTMPVVDLEFAQGEMAVVSLSNRLIVISLRSGDTALDIRLPKVDEPYLKSTTLTQGVSHHRTNEKSRTAEEVYMSTDYETTAYLDSDNRLPVLGKYYAFMVHSLHHVYFLSNAGDVKFHRASVTGYHTVELIDNRRSLCLLIEENSKSVECWNLSQNTLHCQLDLSMHAAIKTVLQTKLCQATLIILVLVDGIILFYNIIKAQFKQRGSINGGQHLDLVVVDRDKLICTFDSTIPIDFAHVDLNPCCENERVITDLDIVTTLVAFDPPISPKPIERLILPERTSELSIRKNSRRMFFTAVTKDALYVVHVCLRRKLSYVRIPGHYDVVANHIADKEFIYTSQGGIINIYKWTCNEDVENDDGHRHFEHTCRLFVSIDISSSPVLAIKPTAQEGGMFLCSMKNGTISVYHGSTARKALKKVPPLPRTTRLIENIELSHTKAVTLDMEKQELTSWIYQHSTAIESTRVFPSAARIEHYAVLADTAVLIVTNIQGVEIYALSAVHKEPVFRLHTRCAAKAFAIDAKTFILITNDGSIRSLSQQASKTLIKFQQTSIKQVNIKCSKLFTSMLTLNSKPSLVILDDDQHSLAIWLADELIYMSIDLSPHASKRLVRLTSEPNQEVLLCYLENKALVGCRIALGKKNTCQLTPYDTADIYSLKNNCLATVSTGDNRLYLHNIHSSVCYDPISLESECEQLCLNESGQYVFALVKPRVLLMYRVSDCHRLGRLFVSDFVTTMVANEDFVVLAMNDRRLLTLLIADPDDPRSQSKIQALPSRSVQRENDTVGKNVAEQMENFLGMSSDDSDSDEETESKEVNICATLKTTASYRFVHRLHGRHSLARMKNDELHRTHFLREYGGAISLPPVTENLIDDSDDDDVVADPYVEQEHNLDDIREKTLEHDRQQLKGIHLANAGANNLKIVNHSSVTSSTCTLL